MRALALVFSAACGCGSMLPGGEVRVAADRSGPRIVLSSDASGDDSWQDATDPQEVAMEEGAAADADASPDASPDADAVACPPVCVAASQCRPCGKSNCVQRRCM